jgi:light-regulated signal transduction histidine kinase (bacteriophytochrome)
MRSPDNGFVKLFRESTRASRVDITPHNGIDLQYHDRIFEAFQQVKNVPAGRTTGIGIGLTLSRKLARLIGGDITVESTLGAGATFTVTLKVDEISARMFRRGPGRDQGLARACLGLRIHSPGSRSQ